MVESIGLQPMLPAFNAVTSILLRDVSQRPDTTRYRRRHHHVEAARVERPQLAVEVAIVGH